MAVAVVVVVAGTQAKDKLVVHFVREVDNLGDLLLGLSSLRACVSAPFFSQCVENSYTDILDIRKEESTFSNSTLPISSCQSTGKAITVLLGFDIAFAVMMVALCICAAYKSTELLTGKQLIRAAWLIALVTIVFSIAAIGHWKRGWYELFDFVMGCVESMAKKRF